MQNTNFKLIKCALIYYSQQVIWEHPMESMAVFHHYFICLLMILLFLLRALKCPKMKMSSNVLFSPGTRDIQAITVRVNN